MEGIIKHTLKKVTLELVYQAIDERTTEIKMEIRDIKTELKEIKKKQGEDFRYLNQKIDTTTAAINQRLDTVIQVLMTLRTDQK